MFRNLPKILNPSKSIVKPCEPCKPCTKDSLPWRIFGVFNKTLFAACLIHYTLMHNAFGTPEQSRLFIKDIEHHLEAVIPFHFKFSKETIDEKKSGSENKYKNYKKPKTCETCVIAKNTE